MSPMKSSQPWETIHVDIHGPLPRSERGITHILGFIDALTRFAIVKPIEDLSAATVAQVYLENVFSEVGPSKQIFTDQGRQFTSQLM